MVALARAGRRPSATGQGPDRSLRVRHLVVVDVAVRLVVPAVLVGSLYLLFAGHNQPGGGFAGGIVAGAAVALRYVAGGIEEVRSLSRPHRGRCGGRAGGGGRHRLVRWPSAERCWRARPWRPTCRSSAT